MNINNNFTPLAWHLDEIGLQSHRASYAYGHVVPLLASNISLLPFQIIVPTGSVNVRSCNVRLITLEGEDAVGSNLRDRLGLLKVETEDYDIIIYAGNAMQTALPIGQYYLTLTSGDTVLYSDVMTLVSDVSKLTKITWWDKFDMKFGAGSIVYRYQRSGETYQYKNWMYFMEEIGMPEYAVEEEGETRDGLFYPSRILSSKKYKMNVVQCTEAMCDAMRFIHLSDYVEVGDGYGRQYACDNVLVTPEWIEGGAVAHANIEITTDTFVKKLGGGYVEEPVISGDTGVIGEAVIGENFVIGA